MLLGLSKQRTATVRAKTAVHLQSLPRSALEKALEALPEEAVKFQHLREKYRGLGEETVELRGEAAVRAPPQASGEGREGTSKPAAEAEGEAVIL